MSLSKRFFVKIAAEFEAVRPPADGGAADSMWQVMVMRTTEALAAEAPRFDRNRFLAACGYASREAA